MIATGLMVYEVIQAGKPLDEELVLAAAKKCGKVITCEEHSAIGGLGEAVCSLTTEHLTEVAKDFCQ